MAKITAFASKDMLLGLYEQVEHEDVELLQRLLRRFGHAPSGDFQLGHFCARTEAGVKRFQRFYGLAVDGVCGSVTKTALMEPRCGVPDSTAHSASFVLRGCKYPTRNLTYAFENDNQILGETARDIVRNSFEVWQAVTPLRFTEVLPLEGPHFRIGWFSGAHNDGDAFDGAGSVLAHAFFPPPCGGVHAGSMHFDEAEDFTVNNNGIHLGAVAIHEIGHLLGLSHSNVQSAIMFPTYSAARLVLGEDDIEGIQALYGSAEATLTFTASASDSLSSGDESVFEIELPGPALISLDGPDGADFDLYVRRGTPPTQIEFDQRAWTFSSDESLRVDPPSPGVYFVMVRSYRGEGDFTLEVELE